MKVYNQIKNFLLATVILFSADVWPQYSQPDFTVNLHVTFTAIPGCVINENKDVSVDLGNINPSKPNLLVVPLKGDCTDTTPEMITLKLQGDSAKFNNAILKTSNDSVGIELLVNGSVKPLNSPLQINTRDMPTLEARPVMESGVSISAGPFSASLTLQLDVI